MIQSILTAIRTALLADSTYLALSPAVYSLQAPESATLPYTILNVTGGGDENATENPTFDVTVSVICIAESALVAAQAADRARVTLHDAALTLTDGWTLWSAGGCTHRSVILYSEVEARHTYTYAGGVYRVRGYASA